MLGQGTPRARYKVTRVWRVDRQIGKVQGSEILGGDEVRGTMHRSDDLSSGFPHPSTALHEGEGAGAR